MKHEVEIKGSKSEAQRALLLASVYSANITNLPENDDVSAAKRFAVAMGARPYGDAWTSGGKASCAAYVGSSATTLRMGLPLMLAVHGKAQVSYDEQLAARPMDMLLKLFEEQNIRFACGAAEMTCQGKILPGNYVTQGGCSSQFLSGLLLALSSHAAVSAIQFENIPSFQYVQLTIDMLRQFGVNIQMQENILHIDATKAHAANIDISSDWSSAVPFIAAKALGHNVTIRGRFTEKQPDSRCMDILRRIGYQVNSINEIIKERLKPVQVDCDSIPDMVPFLTLVLTQVEGESILYNVGRLQYKESDRLEGISNILGKLGANVKTEKDRILIKGKKERWCGGISLETRQDHRMVMLAAIAQLNCMRPCHIQDKDAVRKSYPTFWEDYQKIEVNHEYMG